MLNLTKKDEKNAWLDLVNMMKYSALSLLSFLFISLFYHNPYTVLTKQTANYNELYDLYQDVKGQYKQYKKNRN